MSRLPQPRRVRGTPPKESALAHPPIADALAADIRALIDAARLRVAHAVNAELVLLYGRLALDSGMACSVVPGPTMASALSLPCRDN